MLDITLYSKNDTSCTIDVSESFYEWLSHSKFSKIGKSKEIEITNDSEKIRLQLIELDNVKRKEYLYFLLESISEFSEKLILELERGNPALLKADSYLKDSIIGDHIYFIKYLQALKKGIEQEEFVYMEI